MWPVPAAPGSHKEPTNDEEHTYEETPAGNRLDGAVNLADRVEGVGVDEFALNGRHGYLGNELAHHRYLVNARVDAVGEVNAHNEGAARAVGIVEFINELILHFGDGLGDHGVHLVGRQYGGDGALNLRLERRDEASDDGALGAFLKPIRDALRGPVSELGVIEQLLGEVARRLTGLDGRNRLARNGPSDNHHGAQQHQESSPNDA